MSSSRPIVIDLDTDSDSDCVIDERRSAPKLGPIPSPRTVAHPSSAGSVESFRQLQGRLPAPSPGPQRGASGQPVRKPPRINSRQPSARVHSNAKSLSPRRKVQASLVEPLQLREPISKLQIAQTDYSHRHVNRRESRRCTNCEQDGRCCDGEAPCATCLDPGFVCLYPGEEPIILPRNSTPDATEAEQDIRMSSSDEWTAEYESEQVSNGLHQLQASRSSSSKGSSTGSSNTSGCAQKDMRNQSAVPASVKSDATEDEAQGANDADVHETEKNVVADTPMDLDERTDSECDTSDNVSVTSNNMRDAELSELESVPTTLWLPNSFEEVRKLIEIHESNITSHREYIVEAQLANAKLTAKRNIHIDEEQRGVNPFKRMIADQPRTSSIGPTYSTFNVKVKARRSDYTNLKVFVEVLGEDKAAHIPEYKSIGRLRSVFLSRNVYGLKFVPYNPGIEERDLDERRKDLETQFKDHSSEEFRRQRECLELVYQWSDDFDEILQELHISQPQLYKWLVQKDLIQCHKCETSCGDQPTMTPRGIELSKAERQRCQWLHSAMMKITQIGMWHFLLPKPGQIDKNPDAIGPVQKKENLLCLLCFTHNCLTHGSFLDDKTKSGQAVINDPELQNNKRQKAVLKSVDRDAPPHTCGLYCLPERRVTARDNFQDIVGLGDDGRLDGLRNKSVTMLTEIGEFQGEKPCENVCFLLKANRIRDYLSHEDIVDNLTKNNRAKKELVTLLSKVYGSHLRLPCMIGKMVGVECAIALHVLMHLMNKIHVQAKRDQNTGALENTENRKISSKATSYSTLRSLNLENRKTWVPCSHKGPCSPNLSDCACAREQVHCEKSCGCSDTCRRRFKGCRCKKTCFTDDRCDCFAAHRECDPMLCHDCGVEEVLDPSNKYRDDVRNGRCRNNRLQLDLPPRTVMGMSEVQGWGLFLGEDLPAHSFIGEYKGEKISESESNRRGAIYAYVSQEYLFNLTKDNQLDGSRFGNKTRFINNSKAKEFINVYPKYMFVNGVTRIALFTSRSVKAGEELLYDYGYPEELVKGEFWEKHERAVEHNGVVTPIARPKFRPRMAKNAVDTPGQEQDESDDDPIPFSMRKKTQSPSKGKRKRRLEEISADSDEDQARAARNVSAQDTTDSSVYEEDEQLEASSEEGTTSHDSGEEEVDESEDELSIPTRRVIPSHAKRDRRRGGEAQRRAAETRKRNQNKMRGK